MSLLELNKFGYIDKEGKFVIEAHEIYKEKLTGCCQEGQVHHTLSERLSTDAKVWSKDGIAEYDNLKTA